MGFFDLFRTNKNEVAPKPRALGDELYVGDLNDPRISELLRGVNSGGSASGIAITPNTALKVGVAYRCVEIIAGAVKTMPLDVKRRLDERTREDADDHFLWTLLRRRPNRWQTPSEFRHLMQTMVLLRGNGYALIVRSRGKINELVPLTAGHVQVSQNSDLSLKYTYHRKDGRQVVIPQRDMFHLRGLSLDGIVGLSVIGYARESLGLSLTTEKHVSRFFKNRTSLGGILKIPASVADQEIDRLKANLELFRGSSDEAYADLVLEDGIGYEKIGMSSVDAQFVQSTELNQITIAMFFGVPPHMVGLTTKSTSWGTGIEQQSIGFVNYTLQPWLTMWQEAIDRDLIGDTDSKLYAKFDTKGLLRGDARGRAAYIKMRFETGSINPNEIRALDDENPREGGDEYFVALNQGGSNSAADTAPEKGNQDEEDGGAEDE